MRFHDDLCSFPDFGDLFLCDLRQGRRRGSVFQEDLPPLCRMLIGRTFLDGKERIQRLLLAHGQQRSKSSTLEFNLFITKDKNCFCLVQNLNVLLNWSVTIYRTSELNRSQIELLFKFDAFKCKYCQKVWTKIW